MTDFTKLSELKPGDNYRFVHDDKYIVRTIEKETTNKLIVIKIN